MPLWAAAAIPALVGGAIQALPLLVDAIRGLGAGGDPLAVENVAKARDAVAAKLVEGGMPEADARKVVDQLLKQALESGATNVGPGAMELLAGTTAAVPGVGLAAKALKAARAAKGGKAGVPPGPDAKTAGTEDLPKGEALPAGKRRALDSVAADNRFTRTVTKEADEIAAYENSLIGRQSALPSGHEARIPVITPELLPPEKIAALSGLGRAGAMPPPNAAGAREVVGQRGFTMPQEPPGQLLLPPPPGAMGRQPMPPPNMAGMSESFIPTDQFQMGAGQLQPDLRQMAMAALMRMGHRQPTGFLPGG